MQSFSIQRLDLDPRPTSVRLARHFVRDVLTRMGAGHVIDVAVLLASELVTNAVLHGHGFVRLSVEVRPDRTVRVTVHDGHASPPVERNSSVDDVSGRGMHLVDVLSERWGVEPADDGKAVWFELAR